MEQMLSKFDTFGESLSAVRERVERIEPKIDKLTESVDVFQSAVRTHTDVIRAMQTDLKSITQRLEVVEAKA